MREKIKGMGSQAWTDEGELKVGGMKMLRAELVPKAGTGRRRRTVWAPLPTE